MDKEQRFTAVLEEHKDRIYRICCCYVRDAEGRKDVYQEVLIRLWQGLDSFEGRSQMSTWLYRIAVNTCLGMLRTEQRRKQIFQPSGERTEETVPDHPAPDDEDRLDRDVQTLYDSINALPPGDRTLMSLYLEDVSSKEMSDVLGISEVNVRVKIHRIKKYLREQLGEVHNELE